MTAVISGTFDPITIGHEDIIRRALLLFGDVTVLVAKNTEKKCFLELGDRFEAVKAVFADKNITVMQNEGLVAAYAKSIGGVLVRGVRNTLDFEYEKALAEINRELLGVETVLFTAKKELAFLSSGFVRELLLYHFPIDKYVPEKALPFIQR